MTKIKALIFDFGNVLCSWSVPTNTSISPKTLMQIMSSDIWLDYERGRFSEDECYAKLAERTSIPSHDMVSTMAEMRQSFRVHNEILALIMRIKNSHKTLKVYGMTNTPRPEQDAVHSIIRQWQVFDEVYISGVVKMRKPDICFYNHVLQGIGLPAEAVVFVDDRAENVLTAQSLGMHTVLFQGYEELSRQLKNILECPLTRGKDFLTANAKKMHSVTSNGDIIRDNFAQLLILELTANRQAPAHRVDFQQWERTWNYFIGTPQLTTETFPNDLDTTAIALSVLHMERNLVWSVMDEMLSFVSEDGILMTYFDASRPRVDPVVCVNVLYLFAKYGREDEVAPTFHWVLNVLRNRAYLGGTRYYSAPDVFLYFLSRLSRVLKNPSLRKQLIPTLTGHLRERSGAAGDSVSLAGRVLACKTLGIANPEDLMALCSMQCEDGGWPLGWIYKYGSSGLEIGNRGLSTALAVKAIESTTAVPQEKITAMLLQRGSKPHSLLIGQVYFQT
ncbi:HAD-like protein [Aspergillus alliaceus]|uniref:HAD-like protein n=1 Tax=Petromyces alliaceus TaxID=209559 RepID=A0A5N7C5X6_PETAA|nr:HAD-like protein [Aspergillus alliaceus]